MPESESNIDGNPHNDHAGLGAVYAEQRPAQALGGVRKTGYKLEQETEEDHRDRLFVQVLFIIAINIAALLFIFYVLLPTTSTGRGTGGPVLWSVFGAVIAIRLIFMKSGHRHLCANLLLAVMAIILIGGVGLFGGVRSPTMTGLVILPILAITLMSSRWGYIWTSISIAAWLAVVILEQSGMEFRNVTATENLGFAHALALMGTMLIAMAVLGSYVKTNHMLRRLMADQNKRLDHLASHDTLTGIPNRRFFFEEAQRALNRARRNERPLAVLIIDLRRFKSINDQYGHSVGDALLKNFAEHLLKGFRDTDFVARLGGDEFAVLLTDLKGENAVETAVERFHNTPMQTLRAEGALIECKYDIGCAMYPDEADNVLALYELADQQMYRQKNVGR